MFIYKLSITLYSWAIRFASLFHKKAKLFVQGRKNVFEDLELFKLECKKEILWFHTASLGEFEQGLPLMEAIKAEFDEYAIVVSFFSPSGFEERKSHPIADHTCYLPLDTRRKASRFMDALTPKAAFFIKYEYWFHYLNESYKRSINLYGVSALFTKDHIFFKSYGGFYRKMLKFFNHTFVQNESSLELLKSIDLVDVSISGDTRFDRVKNTVADPQNFEQLQSFTKDHITLVVGSTWPEDMAVISGFINEHPEIRVIIAPHLISKASINNIVKYLTLPFQLYTETKADENKSILILNTMGMLSSAYQYADFAYIGGAFGDGLHNILEAVAFGKPVVFGNKGLEKFPEAEELSKKGGAFSIEDSKDASEVLELLMELDFRNKASKICKEYIDEKAGATDRIMSYLRENLL